MSGQEAWVPGPEGFCDVLNHDCEPQAHRVKTRGRAASNAANIGHSNHLYWLNQRLRDPNLPTVTVDGRSPPGWGTKHRYTLFLSLVLTSQV